MDESDPIRVMIVDDHAMVRSGLGILLGQYDDLKVVAEAADAEEAIRLCANLQPDLLLMDIILPGINGIEATRQIRQQWPQMKVIVITGFDEEVFIQEALQAGAISYLLKDISIPDLVEAIKAGHAGRSILSPQATEALIRATTEPPPLGHNLTPRERDVLMELAHGCSNREIAEILRISRSTVKHHVSHILSKLEASSRAEAAALAMQHQIIES